MAANDIPHLGSVFGSSDSEKAVKDMLDGLFGRDKTTPRAAEAKSETPSASAPSELEDWLRANFEAGLEEILRKAIEYGSADIELMGSGMAYVIDGLDDASAQQQAAIAFYALGKVARVIGALVDGREPSADSWHDLAVYSIMAQKIQETGFWL